MQELGSSSCCLHMSRPSIDHWATTTPSHWDYWPAVREHYFAEQLTVTKKIDQSRNQVNTAAWSASASSPKLAIAAVSFWTADRTCDVDSLLESVPQKHWSIPRRWQINERTSIMSSSLGARRQRRGKRSRHGRCAGLWSIPRIHKLDLELFRFCTVITCRSPTLHHANLLHEAWRGHCRVINHLTSPLIEWPSRRHQRLTSRWTLCRWNPWLCHWNICWSQRHTLVWVHHLFDRVLTSQGLHVWCEGTGRLNSRAPSNRWQNCRCPLLGFVMSLNRQSLLLDDRLLFPEKWTLADQVQVVRIGLHCDRRDTRSRLLLDLSLHLRCPVSMNTCKLRQLKSLIRTFHSCQMISAPPCVFDQRRSRHPTDHKPRWRSRTCTACHVKSICSTVETKL